MTQDYVPPLPKSSGSNATGCIIGCAIVFVVGLLGTTLLLFMGYRLAQSQLTSMTEEVPRELPALDLEPAERQASEEKLAAFRTAMETGGDPREFSFTGDDLNVMIRNSDVGDIFGDSIYVTIANGEVRGKVSLDLGKLIPLADGRYMNGSATFNVFTEGGTLHVYMSSFQFKGEAASQEFMDGVGSQNFAAELADDPEFKAWVEKIESIKVEGDTMTVTLRSPAAGEVTPESVEILEPAPEGEVAPAPGAPAAPAA